LAQGTTGVDGTSRGNAKHQEATTGTQQQSTRVVLDHAGVPGIESTSRSSAPQPSNDSGYPSNIFGTRVNKSQIRIAQRFRKPSERFYLRQLRKICRQVAVARRAAS
jgi:hypothetical protein